MALYYIRENGTVIKEMEEEVVVISPSLYWFSHAEFPTSSLSKAKRLADSLLGSRPLSYSTIYVERSDGGFDCYAYDRAALSGMIEEYTSANTPCYFLQQFSDQMPLRIDEKLIADTINGISIEMEDSTRNLPSLDSIDFESLAKPFNASTGGGFSRKIAVLLLAVLSISAVADLSLRYLTLQSLQKQSVTSDIGKSMYEIKALLKKYKRVDLEQRRLRTAIKKALSSPLKSLECSPKKGCRYE